MFWAWPAFAADDPPPLGPEGDVPVASVSADGVQKCMGLLQSIIGPTRDHLDRTLISSSPVRGPLFRADLASTAGGQVVRWRFVCPISKPGSVLVSFALDTPPLRSGPWGNLAEFR